MCLSLASTFSRSEASVPCVSQHLAHPGIEASQCEGIPALLNCAGGLRSSWVWLEFGSAVK